MNNSVLSYGFNEIEISALKKAIDQVSLNLVEVYSTTDLIANFGVITIISANGLALEDYEEFLGYYDEIGPLSETVVFIGEIKHYQSKICKKCKHYPSIEAFVDNSKYVFLSAKKKERKRHTFSSTVATAIRILSEIKNNPGITSAQLSSKSEVSLRTVQRYIETLRIAGESIVKDEGTNGWKLEFDESLLLLGALPTINSNKYFDSVFMYREILKEHLVKCGLSDEEAFKLSERVRKGLLFGKKYTHPLLTKELTDWFSTVNYLPSVRRLIENEEQNKTIEI